MSFRPFLRIAVRAVLALLLMSAVASPALADARTQLAGRTLNIMVGFSSTGGGAQVWKLVSRVLREKLPDTIIRTRFRDADNALLGTNEMFELPAGSLAVGFVRPPELVFAQIAGRKGVNYDLRRAHWVADLEARTVVMASKKGLTKDFAELKNPAEPHLLPINDHSSVFGRASVLLGAVTGIPSKIVIGFGSSARRKALLAGDIDMVPVAVDYKTLPLFESGDIEALYVISGDDLPPSIKDTPPLSAALQSDAPEKIASMIETSTGLGRAFFAPPNTEPADLQALRSVFNATLNDAELQALAKKQGVAIAAGAADVLAKKVTSLFPENEQESKALETAFRCGLEMARGEIRKCAF